MKALTKLTAAGAGIAGAAYAAYVAKTWLGYGRGKGRADPLLDRFMPDYDVTDHHRIEVEAPASVTLAAAKQQRFEDSRIVRAIFRGRELILRSKPVDTPPVGLLEATKAMGWGVLADEPLELVMGGVTKPWEPNPVFRALPPEEFAAFREPGYVKIVWTLRAEPVGDAASVFVTETRAVATDAQSRAKFRVYWSFLSPGIHLIRRAMLPITKAQAERQAPPLNGDDLIRDPRAQLVHAITIDAPPKDVWPWLVQMGCQRGGWYSWDALDNAGVRSADRIIPELQHIAVGDVLPWRPTGSEGFKVLRVEPERALILGSTAPGFEGTWAFVLEPVGEGKTHLVTRYRASFTPSAKMSLTLLWARALHAIMETKQLKTIKHHAEHHN